jgi:hypothetical protein
MCKFRKIFLFIAILFLCNASFAQYFNQGQDRASIKWKQIQTVNFTVIFPEGFESQGEHVANLLEKSYEYATLSLNHKPKKVSVILHTETVKSNAFLGWAPSRIEMFTTPSQNIYSQDWLEQLSVHEYRHMIQISKIESEMPKILKFLLGEQAAALLTAIYLPFWFIEGDAVAAETGLSNSGRGRSSDFQSGIRAQLVEKDKYSYDKAYLGSYKNYIPNRYELGYLLVGGARNKFKKFVWDDVVSTVAHNPLSLMAFDKGLKKSVGLKKVALYDTLFIELRRQWINEDKNNIPSPNTKISPDNHYYTNYQYGARLDNGNFFAVKSGISEVTSFVEIRNDRIDKKLFTTGSLFDESVSVKDHFIVWSEYQSHLRWDHADNSLIRIYDFETKKIKDINFKSNLFAPVLSDDNQTIVAVEVDKNYKFRLVEIDVASCKKIREYTTPDNDFFITPSWSEKGDRVISVAMRNNQKGIVSIDLKSGIQEIILGFDNQEIIRPKEYNGFIFFTTFQLQKNMIDN